MTPRGEKEMQFQIYSSRGDSWLNNGEYANAIEDYSRAIALLPKHKEIKYVYNNRGWAWERRAEYDKTIEDNTKALLIDPKFDRSYYARGYAWYKKGDLQRALSDAREALKLNPEIKIYDDLVYEIKTSLKNQ
jgi:tetratricopeptide (TPR) repeat protein